MPEKRLQRCREAYNDDLIVEDAMGRIRAIIEDARDRISLDDPHFHGWLSAMDAVAKHAQVVIAECRDFENAS